MLHGLVNVFPFNPYALQCVALSSFMSFGVSLYGFQVHYVAFGEVE